MLACCEEVHFGKQPVVERSSGSIIGYTGVDRIDFENRSWLEWGYRLAADDGGKGYATEAAPVCSAGSLVLRRQWCRALASARSVKRPALPRGSRESILNTLGRTTGHTQEAPWPGLGPSRWCGSGASRQDATMARRGSGVEGDVSWGAVHCGGSDRRRSPSWASAK